jgi:hypothetical protein
MATTKIPQFLEDRLVLNLKGAHRHKHKHMAWNKINGMETILKTAN